MVLANSVKAAEKAKRVQIALDRLADGTYVTVTQAVDVESIKNYIALAFKWRSNV